MEVRLIHAFMEGFRSDICGAQVDTCFHNKVFVEVRLNSRV